ncbi:MAG TPA: sulfotransferase [Thermoanaerobaculia bacterium]|nr:sulfotransferase [Thermoanaerobaculia bacterium]
MALGTVSTAPVFVLSCPRSGSTLLRYILDTHPDICSPGELNLGTLCNALYNTLSSSIGRTLPEAEREMSVLLEVNHIVSGILDRYTRAKGKRIWCEKSPHDNLVHSRLLADAFPDARFVCLYRNCMDFVHSALEGNRLKWWWEFFHTYLAKAEHNQVEAAALYWADSTRKLLAFESAHRGAAYRVTYEDLVFRPESTLEGLFTFLGLPFSPSLLSQVFTSPHDEGSGDSKIRFTKRIESRSVGKGSSVPTSLLSESVLNDANQLLTTLGYAPLGPNFNEIPSPYVLHDAVAEPWKQPREGAAAPEADLAQAFERRISENLARKAAALSRLRATYKIVVEDLAEGIWILDLKHSGGQLRREDGEADCVLTMQGEFLSAILSGTVHPQEAFLRGDIRIRGDEELAAALGLLL